MKKHVLRHHVARGRWWYLYPTKACWTCHKHEITTHVRRHGQFRKKHHRDFRRKVEGFAQFLKSKLQLKSSQELLDFVKQKNLCKPGSIFDRAELRALNILDAELGLEPLMKRNPSTPSRISSLLHWRTLQNLINLCQEERKQNSSGKKKGPAEKKKERVQSSGVEPFYDSHCHVDRLHQRIRPHGDMASFFNQYLTGEGFKACISNFCDPEQFLKQTDIWQAALKSQVIFPTVGCHPKKVEHLNSDTWWELRLRLEDPKTCALGEIGLDYGQNITSRHKMIQRTALKDLLRMAVKMNKPVVLHCRNSSGDCYDICRTILPRRWKIHLHCFTGSSDEAQRWCRYFFNAYIGVTNLVSSSTKDGDRVRNVVRSTPLKRLLLETDSPYFLPKEEKKYRICHPPMARYVAKKLAELKHIDEREIRMQTSRNTRCMYGLE